MEAAVPCKEGICPEHSDASVPSEERVYDFQRNIGNFRSFPLSLPIICPVKVQYLMKYKIVRFLHLLKVIGM